ncbi:MULTISPECIES: hypothetical protein [Sinorhizobium]|uniref:TlpA family protein disulfide reductase n=1 Tax=Sinorhizobium psoraleae TaxID=520838 RepID=A0ABT4KRI7_9HYPH|nr:MULTISPECIES: hypothetical protein [Sinorhizobium]MCZ4094585.1 hypothetical protein [Sinorhizobium psoraleae]MDK1385323.1 hypothetical protein [Sinorhizobium sp. 7-81]MDK1492763.1 hypothetical protein [Sinorhizobium sp. 8-89]
MKPRTILTGIVFLTAAALALLIYDAADRNPAEQDGTRLPATTD